MMESRESAQTSLIFHREKQSAENTEKVALNFKNTKRARLDVSCIIFNTFWPDLQSVIQTSIDVAKPFQYITN